MLIAVPDRREDLQLARHGVGRRGTACAVRCSSRSASSRSSRSAACRASCTRSCRPTRSSTTRTSSSRTSTTCCSAASMFAIFGGLHYWYPKIFGRMLNERLGKTMLLADGDRVQPHVLPDALPRPRGPAPPHVHLPRRAGLGRAEPDRDDRRVHHRPRRCSSSSSTSSTRAKRGPIAAGRPVGRARRSSGSTSSPPPEYNFAEVPVVTHRDEFWHRKYTEDDEGRLAAAAGGRRGRHDRATRDDRRSRTTSTCRRRRTGRSCSRSACRSWATASCSRTGGSLAVGVADHLLRPERLGDRAADRAGRPRRARRRSALMAQAVVTRRRARGLRSATTARPRARDEHRRQQPEARRSGCSSSSESAVLRRVHRDVLPLPRPRRGVPRRPDARRPVQHPVHVGHVVRPADELAHDGARARRDPARRPPAAAHLAARHRVVRADVHRRPGVRVHRVLPRGPARSRTNLFGTTFFMLTGLHGAHVTVGIVWLLMLWGRSVQGRLDAGASRGGRDRGPLLALRRHRVDRHLHRHLPRSPALTARIDA